MPPPPGSNLPALREKISPRLHLILESGAGLIVCLLLAAFVLLRQSVVDIWPFMEGAYESVGLHIYHYGEGLSLEKVRSELRYDGGIMKLAVEGKVHNGTQNIQEIPDIKAVAIGADGQPIQSWQIDAPGLRVFPGETMPFQSTINAPSGSITEINLSFIEIKHDHE